MNDTAKDATATTTEARAHDGGPKVRRQALAPADPPKPPTEPADVQDGLRPSPDTAKA